MIGLPTSSYGYYLAQEAINRGALPIILPMSPPDFGWDQVVQFPHGAIKAYQTSINRNSMSESDFDRLVATIKQGGSKSDSSFSLLRNHYQVGFTAPIPQYNDTCNVLTTLVNSPITSMTKRKLSSEIQIEENSLRRTMSADDLVHQSLIQARRTVKSSEIQVGGRSQQNLYGTHHKIMDINSLKNSHSSEISVYLPQRNEMLNSFPDSSNSNSNDTVIMRTETEIGTPNKIFSKEFPQPSFLTNSGSVQDGTDLIHPSKRLRQLRRQYSLGSGCGSPSISVSTGSTGSFTYASNTSTASNASTESSSPSDSMTSLVGSQSCRYIPRMENNMGMTLPFFHRSSRFSETKKRSHSSSSLPNTVFSKREMVPSRFNDNIVNSNTIIPFEKLTVSSTAIRRGSFSTEQAAEQLLDLFSSTLKTSS